MRVTTLTLVGAAGETEVRTHLTAVHGVPAGEWELVVLNHRRKRVKELP